MVGVDGSPHYRRPKPQDPNMPQRAGLTWASTLTLQNYQGACGLGFRIWQLRSVLWVVGSSCKRIPE